MCWITLEYIFFQILQNIISYKSPKCIGTTSFVYIKHGGPFCKFLGPSILASIFLKKTDFRGLIWSRVVTSNHKFIEYAEMLNSTVNSRLFPMTITIIYEFEMEFIGWCIGYWPINNWKGYRFSPSVPHPARCVQKKGHDP